MYRPFAFCGICIWVVGLVVWQPLWGNNDWARLPFTRRSNQGTRNNKHCFFSPILPHHSLVISRMDQAAPGLQAGDQCLCRPARSATGVCGLCQWPTCERCRTWENSANCDHCNRDLEYMDAAEEAGRRQPFLYHRDTAEGTWEVVANPSYRGPEMSADEWLGSELGPSRQVRAAMPGSDATLPP
jgi:hypothetical protein